MESINIKKEIEEIKGKKYDEEAIKELEKLDAPNLKIIHNDIKIF